MKTSGNRYRAFGRAIEAWTASGEDLARVEATEDYERERELSINQVAACVCALVRAERQKGNRNL